MHGEEYAVRRNKRQPEVRIAHRFVHHAAVHLREPVVYPSEHTKDGAEPHYNVEVRNYEVGIVNVP